MKKLLFITALLIAATATTFAGSNSQTATRFAEKNLSAAIRSQIQFPAYLRESEGEHDATIIFKVTSAGTINVQDVQTDDEDLRADLLSQAPNIRINGIGSLDTRDTYKVVIRFKTL
jgi:hypothetical protein